ncbi:hypothetical protein [Kribbia dieselivorans]|uniref:hypothetical protein n=1 Tax=Kribbia dieselivorans TaxID=331526 RepID=UPI000838A42C|nr:hypothetical protein [Kribbia dieselivorans]
MIEGRIEHPHYDGYDLEWLEWIEEHEGEEGVDVRLADIPQDVYSGVIHLVFLGDRIFLINGEDQPDVMQQARELGLGKQYIWRLDRTIAARFARYMNWDAVLAKFPHHHPIYNTPMRLLPPLELDRDDPRLSDIDLDALLTSLIAEYEGHWAAIQAGPYGSRERETPDEDLPPLD